ncbi:GDSL-type esterase/lipase family protein [Flavobacterium aquatile]|uniref:Acylhydrolase n=1 Tax=Flavobacterium aquatile LMG 4008 = ATCC 11947 TaxID=1453498 RepID=A0A095TZF3_9FLAO|nr:GDSL-type esterase/lipase family protein [Flavobacterium aquatile]KGD67778.1 acylhydrolase [Flavobacterium aquatile LMG 4008 = ATCC 11947]OXA67638.1 acylhydrolase [Flavobacterium aquatile] [Flavobacterium aquatile LMG 4008 = ATCC 11947]GEC78274.1 lipase [Flavobacterium aquatile]
MKVNLKAIVIQIVILVFTPLFIFSQNDIMTNDWANLKKYDSENKQLSTTPSSNRIVFMGDSITEFWKVNDSSFFDKSKINRGISGQTTSQMMLRFPQDVISLKPKAVIILAGINDIAENTGPISNEGILENIISMTELAKANNIKVVLCSVLPANRFNWNSKISPSNRVIELNKMIQSYTVKNKIIYVDFYSQMVDDEDGLQKRFGEDGVHPNKEGYLLMKSIVNEAIEKL